MAAPKVVFSHDGNIDDLVTLCLLLAAHKQKKVQVLCVCITPADSFLEPAMFATRKIFDILQVSDVEVCTCDAPGVNPFPDEWRATPYKACHMPILLADGPPRYPISSEPAHVVVANLLKASTESIIMLETGPLTCFARAFELCSQQDLRCVKEIVWMGGAVDVAGNVRQPGHDGSAEWNAYWDPPAAKAVLGAGIPIVLCALDATNCVPINTSFLTRMAVGSKGSPLAEFVLQMYATEFTSFGAGHLYAWDVLTLSFLLWPDLFGESVAKISVVAEGPSQGRTMRCVDGVPVRLLSAVDAQAWEDRLIAALVAVSPPVIAVDPQL